VEWCFARWDTLECISFQQKFQAGRKQKRTRDIVFVLVFICIRCNKALWSFDLIRNDDLSRWDCFCLLFLSMVEIHFDCTLDCSDSKPIRIILPENMKNYTSRTEELSVQSKCILTIVNTNRLLLDETCANWTQRIIGQRYGFSKSSLYVWSFHSNTSHFVSMIATTTKLGRTTILARRWKKQCNRESTRFCNSMGLL